MCCASRSRSAGSSISCITPAPRPLKILRSCLSSPPVLPARPEAAQACRCIDVEFKGHCPMKLTIDRLRVSAMIAIGAAFLLGGCDRELNADGATALDPAPVYAAATTYGWNTH